MSPLLKGLIKTNIGHLFFKPPLTVIYSLLSSHSTLVLWVGLAQRPLSRGLSREKPFLVSVKIMLIYLRGNPALILLSAKQLIALELSITDILHRTTA